MRPGRWFALPLLGVLVLGTSSCDLFRRTLGVPSNCEPPAIEVSTSDQIFRGTWKGVVEGWPTASDRQDLTLDVGATYLGEESYRISGTFQLGTGPALALTGEVTGGCYETYAEASSADLVPASSPPPVSLDADVRDVDTLVWRLDAHWRSFAEYDRTSDTILMRAVRLDATGDDIFTTSVVLTRTALP